MKTTRLGILKQVTPLFIMFVAFTAIADEGFHNESELGLVFTTGNSSTNTVNLKQQNTYGWALHFLKFKANYLTTKSNDTLSARNWSLGLRYEYELAKDQFNLFIGEEILSDTFAGLKNRYNTDIGGKYIIIKEDALTWFAEAGYRYTYDEKVDDSKASQHYARFYTEAQRNFTKTVSLKAWVELLPNFSDSTDWLLNGELSLAAALSDIFSLKTGYNLRFDNKLNPGATKNLDTTFTTALVAKF